MNDENEEFFLHTETPKNDGDIIFSPSHYPKLIVLTARGDIYVKGKLIENNKELVDGLQEFFRSVTKPELMQNLRNAATLLAKELEDYVYTDENGVRKSQP